MPCEPLLLGIDGGGSKTNAWLAAGDSAGSSRIIGCGAAGPSNCVAVGFETALVNLDAAIDAAFLAAGRSRTCVAAAVLGLAGADRDTVRPKIEHWAAEPQLAARVRIVPDATLVLAAAVGDAAGIALISGTGSLSLGRDMAGRTARAGGWGWLLGDEGSGFALAQAALRAVAAEVDGQGPTTALTAALSSALHVSHPRELVAAIHGTDTHSDVTARAKIAALSPVVVQAAEEGDAVAGNLIERAAADLASLVDAVARQLALSANPFPLALAGGLLLGSQRLRSELARQLATLELTADPMTLVAEPVQGAVRLAQRLVRE